MKKVTLFLMTLKGFKVLDSLIKNFDADLIDFVVIAKDKNVVEDYYYQIKELCVNNNIKIYDRNDDFNITSDYVFAISWRWLIKINSSKLIVLHDSLLPKYRGFSPTVAALINGDEKIGVSAIFATSNYDKGNIIEQEIVSISYPIKIKEAIELQSQCYQKLIISIFSKLVKSKTIISRKQDESQATYSPWLNESDYQINWSFDSKYIKRFIDSTGFPYKGAVTKAEEIKYRIFDSEIIKDVNVVSRNRHIGKVLFWEEQYPIIICGKGLLKLHDIRDEFGIKSVIPLNKFRLKFD